MNLMAKTLGMQWGWNHNPDPTKWSLTQRAGIFKINNRKSGFKLYMMARNTLTQRPFAKHDQTIPTIAVTKMDISKMKDGDIAGLAVFQDPYAYIADKTNNGSKYIIMVNNGKTIDSVAINRFNLFICER